MYLLLADFEEEDDEIEDQDGNHKWEGQLQHRQFEPCSYVVPVCPAQNTWIICLSLWHET